MKQPYLKISLLVVFLLMGPVFGSRAQFYHFSQYSLEEGLPQSEVLSFSEDNLGYIWVGTNGGGLCRFNGRSFDVYTRKNGLEDNIIFGLFQDNEFNLWIGSPSAVIRYDGLKFKKVFVSDSTVFIDEMKFFETLGGNIWLHGNLSDGKKGFFRVRNDSLVNAYDIFSELSKENPVIYVTSLDNNHLLLTTPNGYYDLISDKLTKSDIYPAETEWLNIPLLSDRNKDIWTLSFSKKNRDRKLRIYRSSKFIKDVELPNGIKSISIINIYQDREGNIWISAYDEGVLRYTNGKWKIFNKKNGLPINAIRHINEDAEGNFWFSTLGAGLIRYSGDLFITFDTRSGLSGNIIRSIYQDSKGLYYFGDNGGGLSIYNGKLVKNVFRKGSRRKGHISSMMEIRPGILLLGTITGLYEFDGERFYDVNKKYGFPYPYSIMDIETIGDTLFFATYRAGMIKSFNGSIVSYNKENSAYNVISTTDLFADSKKNLWMCSDKGVWIYRNGTLVNMNKKYDLDVSYFLQAAEDKLGNIWLATFTDGLFKFDGKKFISIGSADGLTSDNIYSVICDDDGNIWAGTQNGVDKLTLSNTGEISSIDNYGKYDGFVGIENNGNANFKDHEGNLWFGTIKGAIKYNPAKKRVNYLPPPVYIKNIEMSFKKVNWNDPQCRKMYDSLTPWLNMPVDLELPHDRNHISFSFDGLCYTVPEKVRYKWRLDPVEKEYLPTTRLNKAVYPSLSPGNYTFYVKACNNSGIWNDTPAKFTFTVEPAWWQTIYLKILILIVLLSIITVVIHAWRKRDVRYKQEMRSLVESKSAEINKQKEQISKTEIKIGELDEIISDLRDRVRRHEENLKELAELGSDVLSGITIEQVFMNCYRDISDVMDVSLCGLGILNRLNKTLDFQNVIINNERIPFIRFPMDDTGRITVFCILNDREIFMKDFEKEYHKYVKEFRPVSNEIKPRTAIFIPLKVKGTVKGVFTVQNSEAASYSEYQLDFVRVVARYLAAIIDLK